jgi:hypothetical protein
MDYTMPSSLIGCTALTFCTNCAKLQHCETWTTWQWPGLASKHMLPARPTAREHAVYVSRIYQQTTYPVMCISNYFVLA